MQTSTARTTLERMLQNQANATVALSDPEIDDLLAMSALSDCYGLPPPYGQPAWSAITPYPQGAVVRATQVDDQTAAMFRVETAGTSGATEPAWDQAAGAQTVDGTVTWQAFAYAWVGEFDLNIGAAEGWRWKAGRIASRYDFSQGDSQQHQRSQFFEHCQAQANFYRDRITGTIPIGQDYAAPATAAGGYYV